MTNSYRNKCSAGFCWAGLYLYWGITQVSEHWRLSSIKTIRKNSTRNWVSKWTSWLTYFMNEKPLSLKTRTSWTWPNWPKWSRINASSATQQVQRLVSYNGKNAHAGLNKYPHSSMIILQYGPDIIIHSLCILMIATFKADSHTAHFIPLVTNDNYTHFYSFTFCTSHPVQTQAHFATFIYFHIYT